MFWTVTLSLLEGFVNTLKIFGMTLLVALPLGLVLSFGSMSRFAPIRFVVKIFVWIIRGTPLMLQLFVIYYVPGLVGIWAKSAQIDIPVINLLVEWLSTWTIMDRMVAAFIAFIINYSCYFSEIYRGGIESIPRGQYEAGQVLGMTKSQIFFKVVLLQVIKRIVPPMSNEIITLVKDTALVNTISVYEVIWNAQRFTKTDGLLWPLFYTGVFYLVFNGLLTLLFGYIEKKMNYFRS
ncbi:MAG: amino acid ABC transporter permease [Clostridia bacterium]|nr:amino acid ABC transporter permease [Clostridia bacterium]